MPADTGETPLQVAEASVGRDPVQLAGTRRQRPFGPDR
jgi:hypothetical protein